MPTSWTSTTQTAKPRLLLATTIAPTLRAFLLPQAQHFRDRGWRVDAMASGIGTDQICHSTFERVWEADWRRSPLYIRNLMMVNRIRDLVRRHKYDIVHVHTPVAAFVTRLALDRLRHEQNVQVIYTAHGFHFHSLNGVLRNKLFETMERKAANWTDFLVVMNREDLQAAREKLFIGDNRLRFMPGIGVDRSHYSKSAVAESELHQLHRELGVTPSVPLLLIVAEFTKRKRHVDAIRAFSTMNHPHAHLLLAGSGPLLAPMKRLAERLQVADRVHFLGQRSDIPVLMKASRAVVLPSSQEGLPRCIMEAMSMGVPVIGTRIRGTTELLERNAGTLVDAGNTSQLAQAMERVLDDTAAAEAMGETGRQQSGAYDVSHILRLHDELYEEALERRRSKANSCVERSLVQV